MGRARDRVVLALPTGPNIIGMVMGDCAMVRSLVESISAMFKSERDFFKSLNIAPTPKLVGLPSSSLQGGAFHGAPCV